MEIDKHAFPAAPLRVGTPPAASEVPALRRRVAPASAPAVESIELSSFPPRPDTQTNGPTVPEQVHTSKTNTTTGTHHLDDAEDATQDQDHYRIHFPAVLTKNASELSSLQRFWTRHVSLAVEHEACRDHLG